MMRVLDDPEILSSLEPDQLAEAKRHRVPRRRLKAWETVLFWFLRIYVLFMVAVVIYQVASASKG